MGVKKITEVPLIEQSDSKTPNAIVEDGGVLVRIPFPSTTNITQP